MKIFDCFTYMNEDVVLDLRLNHLNNYVDKFIIVESLFFHNGKKKKLNFDINKFPRFKDKIIYLVLDHEPKDIEIIDVNDSESSINSKHILNGMRRDFYQRNYIQNGLKECHHDDIVLISDIDELPKIENFSFTGINNQLIIFKQKMFYYKFNLCSLSVDWFGTRACKKKNLINPQWLRNIKSKPYPFWRVDIFFSKNKYTNTKIIDDGGWHFSYLNSPKEIENKLKNYAHYREFELNQLNEEKINERISSKTSIYNLSTDMKASKFSSGQKLEKIDVDILPKYLRENKNKYLNWLE
jgi:beta-1,4-mannosyl-glycoprotein beta-1,4-N-acetylglucosaminyltransferase